MLYAIAEELIRIVIIVEHISKKYVKLNFSSNRLVCGGGETLSRCSQSVLCAKSIVNVLLAGFFRRRCG